MAMREGTLVHEVRSTHILYSCLVILVMCTVFRLILSNGFNSTSAVATDDVSERALQIVVGRCCANLGSTHRVTTLPIHSRV